MDKFDPNALSSMPLVKQSIDRHKQAVGPFSGWTVLFIQHQLENHLAQTDAMFSLGLDPNKLFWIDIPYTSHSEIVDELISRGVPKSNLSVHDYVLSQCYKQYQHERVCAWYHDFITHTGIDEPLLVLDDGAYFLEAMVCFKEHPTQLRIVEQTTRGIRRMEANDAIDYYCKHIPVINVAESAPKKEIESKYIGQAVCKAVHEKMTDWATSESIRLTDINILILGYGAIGSRVACAIRDHSSYDGDRIYVSDSRAVSSIKKDEFKIWDKKYSDVKFGLVIGCTGKRSFDIWDYIYLEPNAMLISASSGSTEVSREAFVELAASSKFDDIYIDNEDQLDAFHVHDDLVLNVIEKKITIANGGFPINFDHRLNRPPADQMQLTVALMIEGAVQAVLKSKPGLNDLNPEYCAQLMSDYSSDVNFTTHKIRQAVLVIHGIGEQLPMETLRKFVDAAIIGDKHSAKEPKYYSKPDLTSETLEMRKLSDISNNEHRKTDFYEYYWAHLPGPGKTWPILKWIGGLLVRPRQWSKRLSIFIMLAFVVLAVIIGFILSHVDIDASSFKELFNIAREEFGLTLLDLFNFVGLVFAIIFGGFLLNYVGDAEKYLSAKPANIAFRKRIRSDGLKILRHLHQSGYDRVIVVGHSLGSVIAYDLVRYLWIEYNDNQRRYEHFNVDKVNKFIEAADDVKSEIFDDKPSKEIQTNKREDDFQEAQHELWKDQKTMTQRTHEDDCPWLISDMITLGCPLVHGQLLLTGTKEAFEIRKNDRELPVCPQVEEDRPENKYRYFYDDPGFFVPHHAAPFSCTRWTNIYYSGDYVGGPLGDVFGKGIKDIRIPVKLRKHILCHTHYWKHPVRSDSPMINIRKIIWPNEKDEGEI